VARAFDLARTGFTAQLRGQFVELAEADGELHF
jgi:hypothetical protein